MDAFFEKARFFRAFFVSGLRTSFQPQLPLKINVLTVFHQFDVSPISHTTMRKAPVLNADECPDSAKGLEGNQFGERCGAFGIRALSR